MPDVRFTFVASGADSVSSAFQSIASSARAAERATERYNSVASRPLAHPSLVGLGGGGLGPYRTPGAGGGQQQQIAERGATYQLRAANAMQRAHEQAAERSKAAWVKSMSGIGGAVADLTVGATMRVGGMATDAIGGAARQAMKLQEIANRVSINARGAGQEAVDPTMLRKEFENVAIATPGIKSEDVGEAAQAYVDLTGDLQTARDNMQTFATTASATGASIKDVATAAASLGKQFDVKSAEDMKMVLANLTQQGKGGAVTMKDLAAQFQKLAAAGHAFGLDKGPGGVAKLGGLLQIARTSTKTPAAAATSVENILSGLVTKTKILDAAGVATYDKKGNRRDVQDILVDAISKLGGGGNLKAKDALLSQVFGKQGGRGVAPLVGTYKDVYQSTKGTDAEKQAAGVEALRNAFKLATDASSDFGENTRDAAQAQKDSSAKLNAAWESIKANVGDKLLPPLAKLADTVSRNADAFNPLINAAGGLLDVINAITGAGDTQKPMTAAGEQKKLDELNAKLGAKGLSEMSASDADLRGVGSSREDLRHMQSRVRRLDGADKIPNFKNADEFTQWYKENGQAKTPWYGISKEKTSEEAAQTTKALMANPTGLINSDSLRGLGGETELGKRGRHAFLEQQQGGEAGGESSKAAQAKLDEFAASAARAKAVMDQFADVKVPASNEGSIAPQ